MPGLIRSKEENARIDARVKKRLPVLDTNKIAAYEIGDHHFWIYPLASLTKKERDALKSAGYTYYGRNWAREGADLHVVK